MKLAALKYIISFFLIITVLHFPGCSKNNLENKLYVRGRLFLTDTLIQRKVNLPLGQKKIMIANTSDDGLNYLYTDSTDTEGYFLFELLENGNKNFVIRYADSIGGFYYKAEQPVTRGDDQVAVIAYLDTINLTAAIVNCIDTLGGGMPGTKVSFYSSEVLARINDSTAATLNIKADNYGRATTFVLNSGQYFVNAILQADTISFKKIGEPVFLEKGRLNPVNITLRQ